MRGRVFCFLGREQYFSREGTSFPSGCLRDAFGMDMFWTDKEKGLVLPFKRTRFTLQKDSFWTAKGFVLKGKRSPFQNVECWMWNVEGVEVEC